MIEGFNVINLLQNSTNFFFLLKNMKKRSYDEIFNIYNQVVRIRLLISIDSNFKIEHNFIIKRISNNNYRNI